MAPREGFYQGHLALADDDLAVDNRYYFTYPVSARPSLLTVDGGPGSRDAFFLRKAFALGETALYDFDEGTRGRLSRAVLRSQDVVFLANAPGLTEAQAGNLREFVEQGGSLVVSFGEQVDVAFLGWHDTWLSPAFEHWNLEEYLPRIEAPVLMVQGEGDEYGTIAQVDAIEAGLRGPTTRLVLPGCGHVPHREQPETVLGALTTFLAELP